VISKPKRKSAAAGVVQIMSVSLNGHLPGDSCKNVQFVRRMVPMRRQVAQPCNHDFALMIFMKRHGCRRVLTERIKDAQPIQVSNAR
jgi:hypothetical protein